MIEIKQKILAVMATVFMVDASEVPDDCSYGSFDRWDSLAHMNLIVGLEEEFSIRFSDDEVTDVLSFDLIYVIVNSKISKSDVSPENDGASKLE